MFVIFTMEITIHAVSYWHVTNMVWLIWYTGFSVFPTWDIHRSDGFVLLLHREVLLVYGSALISEQKIVLFHFQSPHL